ncbi:MAG TPA: biotin--[acetyl-CoA-carboxylase] ligase [Nocardioidaceae bacterium]|nr:biotin--[acetyl-CoA-carboxylase] ligase [Nocardioidaceae bacterium]
MTFDDLRRPPLDRVALSAALTREGSLWRGIELLQESASTNSVVAERARLGEQSGLVVVAEHQTSGRGRLDRSWVTPPRAALTFSFLVTPDRVPAARWPWLPLLVGIAVSEAVRRVAEVDAELKWPNDVLVAEQKVAGILVERVERVSGPAAVVGIGLNVSSSADELPVPTATSLALHGARTLDRSVILREVLRAFEALYVQWQAELGDAGRGLLESYVRRCSTLGRQVRVDLPTGEQLHGEAVGIDTDGRLQVRTGSGVRVLGAGDVVHVRAEPGPPDLT